LFYISVYYTHMCIILNTHMYHILYWWLSIDEIRLRSTDYGLKCLDIHVLLVNPTSKYFNQICFIILFSNYIFNVLSVYNFNVNNLYLLYCVSYFKWSQLVQLKAVNPKLAKGLSFTSILFYYFTYKMLISLFDKFKNFCSL